jgi:predicted permease
MGLAADSGRKLRFGPDTVKKILSPPLLGALLGAAFALTGVNLPGFLTDAVTYMGSITTPVACVLAGCTISRMGLDVVKIPREGWLTFAGRFVFGPLISLGLCLFANAPALVTRVFTVESAMPVMSQSMLLALTYNANHRLAAQMITLTTVVGLLYVPLLVFVLERVG